MQEADESSSSGGMGMEISPIKRPRVPGVVPDGILGNPGLKKMGLRLDTEHSMIFFVDEIELIV
jgi:hypothetical protein